MRRCRRRWLKRAHINQWRRTPHHNLKGRWTPKWWVWSGLLCQLPSDTVEKLSNQGSTTIWSTQGATQTGCLALCVLHDSQAYKVPKYLATELTGPNGWTTSSYCTRELGAWYMKPSSSGCKRCQRMRSKCPLMCCLFYLLSIRSDCQSSPMGTKRLSIPLGKDLPVSRGRSGSSNPMSWCYIQTESGWWEAWTPLTVTYSNGDYGDYWANHTAGSPMVGTPIILIWRPISLGLIKDLSNLAISVQRPLK